MPLRERIGEELKTAMRARDSHRVNVLRMLRSKLQEKEVELRGKKGREYELAEDDVLGVISAYAKQRRDSIDSFEQASRPDLVEKEKAELAVVAEYLPAQLGEDEIKQIVTAAIAESGAEGPSAMGAVMKLVMPKVKGKADGKLVNRIVRETLAG